MKIIIYDGGQQFVLEIPDNADPTRLWEYVEKSSS